MVIRAVSHISRPAPRRFGAFGLVRNFLDLHLSWRGFGNLFGWQVFFVLFVVDIVAVHQRLPKLATISISEAEVGLPVLNIWEGIIENAFGHGGKEWVNNCL